MTVEEKARAYDEALERARERYEKVPDSVLGLNLVGIFPELKLKYSEDERIKKEIIRTLKGELRYTSQEDTDRYVAWLEKQKDTNVLIQEASEKAYTEGMRVERKHWLEKQGKKGKLTHEDICKAYNIPDIGEFSDGYHTFNGLYKQRMILFAVLVKTYKDKAWKSWKHEDGLDCFGGGWFIVGIDTPDGTYTYHYEAKDWDRFDCQILEKAKHWDGHDEFDVERLFSLVSNDNKIKVLEKQSEKPQCKTTLEVWKDMRLEVYQQASGNRHEPNYSDDSTKMFSLTDIDEIFDKIAEKQGEQNLANSEKICKSEQKPTDKVEPKFHEGDFIVGTYCRGKIIALTDDAYLLDTGQGIPFSCKDNVHLWTIQDAKDGDVLVDKCGNIGIYQGDKNIVTWNSYCYCGVNKVFYDEGSHEFPCYPATKEQRDTLMEAMTDAGYVWDAENKKLNKIEHKSVWSEEDEHMLNETIQHLEELIRIDKAKHLGCDVQYYQRDIDWLKSLKERVQPQNTWKPSNEQMEVLLSEVTGWKKGCPKQIVLESLYNDLKKLK